MVNIKINKTSKLSGRWDSFKTI